MGVTVGVLVLLMFSIHALSLFDRIAQRRQTAGAGVAVLEAPAGILLAPEPGEATTGGEIVAAIATALALAEAEGSPATPGSSGATQTQAGDVWAVAGRQRLMDRRGRPSR